MKLDSGRVRERRERLALSIEDVSEKARVSPHTWIRAEHGEEIRPSSVRRIADVLGVAPGELMEDLASPKAEAPTSSHEETDEERRVTVEQLKPAIRLMQTFSERLRRKIADYDEGLGEPERAWAQEVEGLAYMYTNTFEEQGLTKSVEAVNEGRQMTDEDVRRLSVIFDRELKIMHSLVHEAHLIAGLADTRTWVESVKGQTKLDEELEAGREARDKGTARRE